MLWTPKVEYSGTFGPSGHSAYRKHIDKSAVVALENNSIADII